MTNRWPGRINTGTLGLYAAGEEVLGFKGFLNASNEAESGLSMPEALIQLTIVSEGCGELKWTLPPDLSADIRLLSGEAQESLLRDMRDQVEASLHLLLAVVRSGEAYLTLLQLVNSCMQEATEDVVKILEAIESGELPPCGRIDRDHQH